MKIKIPIVFSRVLRCVLITAAAVVCSASAGAAVICTSAAAPPPRPGDKPLYQDITHPKSLYKGKDEINKEIQDDRDAIAKRMKMRNNMIRQIDSLRKNYMGKSEWTIMSYKIIGGDTVFVDQLPPVFKFKQVRRMYKGKVWRQYYRLVYNFKRVYPYALQARAIIREADSVLAVSNFTPSQRDAYIKAYQNRLFKQFEKPIRRLTITQGRLLMKLIDRELGMTSFYIIREYRGRLAAGFWQTVARIFGSDLKKPYDRFGEDRQVEDLVVLYQAGAFDSLYYSMFRD